MTDTGKIWENLGELGHDCELVITQLFIKYEELLEKEPNSNEANRFFSYLENTLEQVSSCNANRR